MFVRVIGIRGGVLVRLNWRRGRRGLLMLATDFTALRLFQTPALSQSPALGNMRPGFCLGLRAFGVCSWNRIRGGVLVRLNWRRCRRELRVRENLSVKSGVFIDRISHGARRGRGAENFIIPLCRRASVPWCETLFNKILSGGLARLGARFFFKSIINGISQTLFQILQFFVQKFRYKALDVL